MKALENWVCVIKQWFLLTVSTLIFCIQYQSIVEKIVKIYLFINWILVFLRSNTWCFSLSTQTYLIFISVYTIWVFYHLYAESLLTIWSTTWTKGARRTSLAPSHPSKSVLLWNCGATSDKRNYRPPWNSDNFESPIGLYQTVSEGHWMLSNRGCHVASARKHSIPVFVARDRAIYKLPAVWCGLKQSGPPGGNECVFHSVHTVDTDLWGANAKLSGLLNLEVRAGQKELNGIESFNVC